MEITDPRLTRYGVVSKPSLLRRPQRQRVVYGHPQLIDSITNCGDQHWVAACSTYRWDRTWWSIVARWFDLVGQHRAAGAIAGAWHR
ncbi:hypothetical protein D3C85_1551720 [compost metagenome]